MRNVEPTKAMAVDVFERNTRVDDAALALATGRAAFLDDVHEPSNTLHIAVGLAPIAAGKITRIDLEEVRKAEGVRAVLTAADIPGRNDASPLRTGDDPVIGSGEIGFQGQVLFAVVAGSRDAARRAVPRARLFTTPSIPTADIEDALATDATVSPDTTIAQGDAAAEMQRCDRRLVGQLRIGGQAHFALEVQAALAMPRDGGGIRVLATIEDPGGVHRVVADMLGLQLAAVEVEARRIGGGFGGKRGGSFRWAALAALAASVTGRPCKLRLDRVEDLVAVGKRPDFRVNYGVGFTDTGLVRAVDLAIAARCGNGADLSGEFVDRAMLHADNAYFYPAVRISGRRMRTNTVPATWFRGAGAEGVLFAERVMDHIACNLGLDPLDVRKTNFYGEGRDRTPYGGISDDNLLAPLVTELERTSTYRRRRRDIIAFNQTSPILRKGLALTPLKYGVGSPRDGGAAALVTIHRDGSIRFADTCVEEGQGLEAKAIQLVASEFGIGTGAIERWPASTATLPAPWTASIDQALLAVIAACRAVKSTLLDFVEGTLEIERERVEFRDGRVQLGARAIEFADLAEMAATAQVAMSATGFHRGDALNWNPQTMTGRPFRYHVHGAACAEVTIDVMTGEHRIDRVDILQDVGRSLIPSVDAAQIESGFTMGLGWLTSEEVVLDSSGRLVTNTAASYLIPTVSDIPADLRVSFFQAGGSAKDPLYRSKDIVDASVLTAISVFLAISDAIGSLKPGTMPRLNAPATPETIMRAIRGLADSEP